MRPQVFVASSSELLVSYKGPVSAAALVGMLFDNWIPVKMYQQSRGAERYEYWAPLIKTV